MRDQTKNSTVTNKLTRVLFTIYLVALCWILLLKLGVHFSYMTDRRANLIPFNGSSILTSENILNVLIFVPLGIYVAILFKGWTFRKKLLLLFLISLLIEGLQFILRIGAFDVTDVITNTLGGVIGLLLFKAISSAFGNSAKAQKLVNVVAAIGTVSMLLLLLLLKMDMLRIRYR